MSNFKKICWCTMWGKLGKHLDNSFTYPVVHGIPDEGYEGFIYCPWCGIKLATLDTVRFDKRD